MAKHKIGIIGGTGLYCIEGFTKQKWVKVKTPFGKTSMEKVHDMGFYETFIPARPEVFR